MTLKYQDAGYDLRKQADGLKSQTRQYVQAGKKRKVSREHTAEHNQY